MNLYSIVWNSKNDGFGYDSSGFFVAQDEDWLKSHLGIHDIYEYAITGSTKISKESKPGWLDENTFIEGKL